MGWDDERTKLCIELWQAGHSCSLIARKLGDTTRNAVIGKLHRMGYRAARSPDRVVKYQQPRRKMPLASAPRPELTRRARVAALREMPSLPLPEVGEVRFIPLEQRKGVLDLEADDCRWPIGDPRQADFHFCAQTKLPGFVYCASHAQRAYAPPQGMPERDYFATGLLRRKLKAA